MRDVLLSGEAVACADCRDFGVHYDRAAGRPGGAAPIRWDGEIRGALTVIGKAEAQHSAKPSSSCSGDSPTSPRSPLEQGDMHERLGDRERLRGRGPDGRDRPPRQLHVGNSQSVMALAERVARRSAFDEAALAEISLAARLHDVGKIGVPDAILLKEGPLDESEWEVIRCCPAGAPR